MIIEETATSASIPAALPHRRRRSRTVLILLGAAVLVVIAAASAVLYLANLSGSFDNKTGKISSAFPDESTRPSPLQAADGKTPINILLVGSDSRGATAADADAGKPSDQRSDTMMLVHIPADRQHVYIVSIMRDLWVPIPGHGPAKINAALAYGGEPLMVQTVESLLGQRVDHVAFIDFQGFKALTDAVDGVTVDVKVPFTASLNSKIHFNAGPQTMNGDEALAFVRERYAFPDGDYQRVRDQQAFFEALVAKMATPTTLANPVTLANVVNEFAPYLKVDSGFTSSMVTSLAFELRDVHPNDIVAFTLPTSGTGWSADGQSIVLPDRSATGAFAEAMAKGTVPRFVAQHHL